MRDNLHALDRQRRAQTYSPKPRRPRPPRGPETGLPVSAEAQADDHLASTTSVPGAARRRLSARQGMGLVTVLLNVACAGAAASMQAELNAAPWAPLRSPAPSRGPRALLGQPLQNAPAAAPPPPPPPRQPAPEAFGNLDLHPDKFGFYLIPDLPPALLVEEPTLSICRWPRLERTLARVQQLVPGAWLRWDNESGHNVNNRTLVEDFVRCTASTQTPLIITASAVDHYDNWWAGGNKQPTVSITDIANGPYLSFARELMDRYPNIRFTETINEVDGVWFVADPANVTGFNYYMDKLTAAFDGDTTRLLGPSTAFTNSPIYEAYLARPEAKNISFHAYLGAASLNDVPGRSSYITEYGTADTKQPAGLLADWYQLETLGKLSGSTERIFYNQFFDDGSNRGVVDANGQEGDRFAIRDWPRALGLTQRLANISRRAYVDIANDYVAADDRTGRFGALLWNVWPQTLVNGTRTIYNTSLRADTPLYSALVTPGDNHMVSCLPLNASSPVAVDRNGTTVVLRPQALPSHAAVLIATDRCDDLVD